MNVVIIIIYMITIIIIFIIICIMLMTTVTRFQYNQMEAGVMLKLEGERGEGMQCAGYK